MAEKVTFLRGGEEIDVSDVSPLPVTPGSKPIGAINRTSFTVTATGAVTLFPENEKRKLVIISNIDTSKSLFVKFQAASIDNLKNDICIKPADPPFVVKAIDGPVYTGEISVIAASTTVDLSALEISEE